MLLGYQSLLALYLGGTPSLRTGSRPLPAYTSTTVYLYYSVLMNQGNSSSYFFCFFCCFLIHQVCWKMTHFIKRQRTYNWNQFVTKYVYYLNYPISISIGFIPHPPPPHWKKRDNFMHIIAAYLLQLRGYIWQNTIWLNLRDTYNLHLNQVCNKIIYRRFSHRLSFILLSECCMAISFSLGDELGTFALV